MLARITDWSLRNKFLVLALTALLVAVGVASMLRLPIERRPHKSHTRVFVQLHNEVLAARIDGHAVAISDEA